MRFGQRNGVGEIPRLPMEINGLDGFRRKIDKLHGTHQVTLDQLFHPLFMLENSSFGSISEFFAASPFVVNGQDDLNALDEAALDEYVRNKTRFESWHDMKDSAAKEWMIARFNEESS
jgi:hypothetical protein